METKIHRTSWGREQIYTGAGQLQQKTKTEKQNWTKAENYRNNCEREREKERDAMILGKLHVIHYQLTTTVINYLLILQVDIQKLAFFFFLSSLLLKNYQTTLPGAASSYGRELFWPWRGVRELCLAIIPAH